MHISNPVFNINKYEQDCFRLFLFLPRDIGRILALFNSTTGMTESSRYAVEALIAACAALRNLSNQTYWKGVEEIIVMRASAMCEVFYEVIKSLVS